MGILRYNDTSQEDPATKAHEYGKTCADEPYENLKPILPWRIGKPSNERKESICERMGETKRVCGEWNKWLAKQKHFEQDDSGI